LRVVPAETGRTKFVAAKHLGLAILAATILAGNTAVAVAQEVDTTGVTTIPADDDDDEGMWGLLGLLGLAGLLGLKRRDRHSVHTTDTTANRR
jgi:MYXO-CTERM domain-containing protein